MKRTITTISFAQGKEVSKVTRQETDQEETEREKREEEIREREESRQANATDLICDKCGGVMGKVYEGDLNGSRFYHSDCI
jgi:hypothetical protein